MSSLAFQISKSNSALSIGEVLYHHHDMLDPVCESIVAAFLPVCCRIGLFTEHHGGAMRKEMYWSSVGAHVA